VANARSKLTPEKVIAIRADPRPSKLVAAEYGIDESNVRKIRRGKTWLAVRSSQVESNRLPVPNTLDCNSLIINEEYGAGNETRTRDPDLGKTR
jgi:hypothetical protein